MCHLFLVEILIELISVDKRCMKVFDVWPFDDTTVSIVIGQFTLAGSIMVVGKTLTRSPWTTHKDYPKMEYAAED